MRRKESRLGVNLVALYEIKERQAGLALARRGRGPQVPWWTGEKKVSHVVAMGKCARRSWASGVRVSLPSSHCLGSESTRLAAARWQIEENTEADDTEADGPCLCCLS